MSSQIFKSSLPYLALLIAHLIWGANFVVAKITLFEFPPMSLAFLRFAIASFLVAPFFYADTKQVNIKKEDYPKLILIGLLIITFNITFFFTGIQKTTATNASVLTMIIPILSIIGGWAFLKEKITFLNIVGLITGFFGILIIIGIPEIVLGNFAPKEMLGNFLIILAAISWVLGTVLSKEMLQKYPSSLITIISFLVGTVTFLLPAINEYLQNPTWISNISLLGLTGLAYMALLSSISAYLLFEWGLAKTSVSKAGFFQYIEPVIASSLAVSLLGEKITVPFVAGAFLIIASVYLGMAGKQAYAKHQKMHRH